MTTTHSSNTTISSTTANGQLSEKWISLFETNNIKFNSTFTLNIKKFANLNTSIDAFLKSNYFDVSNKIVISSASYTEENNQLVITGRSSFFKLNNTPVKLVLFFDENQTLQTYIQYSIADDNNSLNKWVFSTSFPKLPVEFDLKNPKAAGKSPLDKIMFKNTCLYVSSCETNINENDTLFEGVTFLANAYANEYIGKYSPLASLSKTGSLLSVKGEIIIPKSDVQLSQPKFAKNLSEKRTYPWDAQKKLPGIYLSATLDFDLGIKGLTLEESSVDFYAPLDEKWIQRDAMFENCKAIRGKMVIDSHKENIEIQTTAVLSESNSIYFDNRFEGLSLDNLGALAGVLGNDDPFKQLPSALQKPVQALTKIELFDLGFTLSLSKNKISIPFVTFSLGFEDVNWAIWKDHIEVTDLKTRIEITSPFSKPLFNASIFGICELEGKKVELFASKMAQGYMISAALGEKQTLPLTKFMKKFLPGSPNIGALTINELMLRTDGENYVSFAGTLAEKPKAWEIDLGPKSVLIQNVNFDFDINLKSKEGQSRFNGAFAGEAKIDNILLSMKYTMPGDFIMRADVDELNLKKLYKRLTGTNLPAPEGFDLTLNDSSLLVKKDKKGYVLQLMTTVPKTGTFAVEVGRVNTDKGTKWGGAVGFNLTDPKLSKLPGMSFVKPVEKIINMESVLLMISNYENQEFRFPDAQAFSDSASRNTSIKLPTSAVGMTQGFNAHAKWVLNTKNKSQKMLSNVFGLDPTMQATLQVDTSKPSAPITRFYTKIDTTFNNDKFYGQLGVQMQPGMQPEFYAMGTCDMKIGKKNYVVDMGMSVISTGMSVYGNLQGTVNIEGIKISNLALMGSVSWSGVPGVGFAGSLSVDKFSGSVAMLADSASGGSLIAGSVSEMSANDVVTTIAQTKKLPAGLSAPLKKIQLKGTKEFTIAKSFVKAFDAKDLEQVAQAFQKHGALTIPANEKDLMFVVNKKGKMWTITDQTDNLKNYQINMVTKKKGTRKTTTLVAKVMPQIYVCPTMCRIGTKTYNQGFFLSSNIKIFDLDAYANIEINPRKGMAIESYIKEPLVVYNKKYFALTDSKGETGPYLSVSTYKQPKHKIKELRAPHLRLSGAVSMMGLEMANCYANITTKGLDIYAHIANRIAINEVGLKGKLDSKYSMEVAVGSVKNMKGAIATEYKFDTKFGLFKTGSIKFKSAVMGKVTLGFDGKSPYAKFNATFKAAGKSGKIGTTLRVKSSDLQKLDKLVIKEIEKFFTDIYKDVDKFVGDVKKGLVTGFNTTEKLANTLKKDFKQDAKALSKQFDKLGKDVNEVGKALDKVYKLKPKDAAKALKDIRKSSKDVAKMLYKGYGLKSSDVGNTLKDLGYSEKVVKDSMKAAGVAAKDIEKFGKSAYKTVSKTTKKATKAVSKTANKSAKSVSKSTKKATKSVKKTSKKAKKKLKKIFK